MVTYSEEIRSCLVLLFIAGVILSAFPYQRLARCGGSVSIRSGTMIATHGCAEPSKAFVTVRRSWSELLSSEGYLAPESDSYFLLR